MGYFSKILLGLFSISVILTHVPEANADDDAGQYQDFVDAHNKARAEVGVPPLEWSDTLRDYAQNYANTKTETCEMVHSGGPYGENLAESSGDLTGEQAVSYWLNEKSQYDHESNSCIGGDPMGCLHYTQLVWSKTTHVGCAKAKCKNGWMFIICSYDPAGNIDGETPYL